MSKASAAQGTASVEAMFRLLTPENRGLLAIIRDQRPQFIAELAGMTGRAQSNLGRTIAKLVACGFVEIRTVRRRRVLTVAVCKVRVEIDPFSQNDRIELVMAAR